ncbi:MAG TPA: vWA domain-containing protein, partial [Gaiellaceae bacterium]
MASHRMTPRDRQDGERGQVIVLIVLLLVVLLGMAALVIDVGYAYYAHRSLQASADAAALAGAQELPDPTKAKALALTYSASTGGKNQRGDLEDVVTTVTTKCIPSIPGCDPTNPAEVNAVVVMEKAPTKTFFAGLLGIDTFKVTGRSTACSPCGVKPLDIMMVLDRTGSMCLKSDGSNDPACTDLKNAQAGMKAFLSMLDPTKQWVGLAVLPPVPTGGDGCTAPVHHGTTPAAWNAYKTNSPYKIVPLNDDYATAVGVLAPSSALISTIDCVKGNGFTAYANALEEAQKELNTNGRAGVKNVIVFLSDGAANIGPSDLALTSPYRKTPCQQGVNSAATIKSNGTLIYSIGYDLDALGGGANVCQTTASNGAPGNAETPAITAYQALQNIATPTGCSGGIGGRCFYNQPNPGE